MGLADETRGGDATVRLEIPARPEFVRIARMTAAGVAAALDFDVEAVDEVRMATDECCQILTGGDWEIERLLALSFTTADGYLSLRGSARPPRPSGSLPPFSERILRELADDLILEDDGELVVQFHRATSGG